MSRRFVAREFYVDSPNFIKRCPNCQPGAALVFNLITTFTIIVLRRLPRTRGVNNARHRSMKNRSAKARYIRKLDQWESRNRKYIYRYVLLNDYFPKMPRVADVIRIAWRYIPISETGETSEQRSMNSLPSNFGSFPENRCKTPTVLHGVTRLRSRAGFEIGKELCQRWNNDWRRQFGVGGRFARANRRGKGRRGGREGLTSESSLSQARP